MIEGGWSFVWGAYAVTIGALTALVAIIALRAAHWSKQARDLGERKP